MMTLTADQILTRTYRGVSTVKRFWSKVDKRGKKECWLWLGYVGCRGKGYGAVRILNEHWGAHRLSWVIHYGDVPVSLFVLHTCDIKRCVNPAHLFLGTYQDNSDDMMAKGRHKALRGEAVSNSKLTVDKVRQIRELFCYEEFTHKTLANRYGVTEENIKAIIDGRTWGFVGGPIGIKKNNRRWIWGERHQDAKLKEWEVLDIRRRAACGERGCEIAELYPRVGRGAIYDIIKRVTWRHIHQTVPIP